jgi:hypothetical protein
MDLWHHGHGQLAGPRQTQPGPSDHINLEGDAPRFRRPSYSASAPETGHNFANVDITKELYSRGPHHSPNGGIGSNQHQWPLVVQKR